MNSSRGSASGDVLIADTSGLLALFTSQDRHHADIAAYVRRSTAEFAVSPFVVAELAYMVHERLGTRASLRMLTSFASPPYQLAPFGRDNLLAAVAVMTRYPDQAIGLADASLVVLAERFRTVDILTLDYRHFDVLRPLQGGRFRLMPRDWDGT